MERSTTWLVAVVAAAILVGCGGAPPTDATGGGKAVYQASCQVCHGRSGEGGVGRPLAGVVETFPDCEDQVRWVVLGSQRWKTEVGPTVGNREIGTGAVMPSFADALSDAEIRRAVAYERTAFAGADPAGTLSGCGLPPAANEE